METIIRQRQVVADNWQLLKPAADGSIAIPAAGDVIVPLRAWREQRATLLARTARLGVWLENTDDPAVLADDLQHFALIAVNFPQFADGRGYSTARLLRERFNWRGELRAIGDILRDQLFYLFRCGFDSYALRADQDANAALTAFDDFSEAYQSSVERPQPLFRRRKKSVLAGVE
ncbi:MAG: oxidoreductase [Betaproteobacteria bacterium]|nr:oxidoreductase [Betaproteobacteria bacterium]